MIDSEYKRVLDKTLRRADQQELQQQKEIDAIQGEITPERIEEFYAVTSSMQTVLDKRETHFSPRVSTSQRYALEALFMAKTAKDTETGEFISGIERSQHLNQALMYLQPILAMALRTDFKEGRALYDQLVSKVRQCRSEIRTAILVQIVPKRKKKKLKKKPSDQPDAAPELPAADAASQDAAGKDAAGQAAETTRSADDREYAEQQTEAD